MLPLWQAIQRGVLQNDAETNAVLAQIEGQVTSEQLEAIATMQLTPEDLRSWAREQGLSIGAEGGPGEMEGAIRSVLPDHSSRLHSCAEDLSQAYYRRCSPRNE